MDMNSPTQETSFTTSIPSKLYSNLTKFIKKIKKIGEDDPRRITHCAKLGLALTLSSLLYYIRPLYNGFGEAGMWAILTVVVVFEFTVGLGAHHLASVCGVTGKPIVVGLMVFSLAAVSTFTRFYPNVKRRYDYGVLIFILTFTMVAVSGYRVGQIVELAHQRLSTVLIGGATCIIVSIFICPVWAGPDLQFLVAKNIEKLADFLQGYGGELLTCAGDESSNDSGAKNVEKSLNGYKSVLDSKATVDLLANLAWWEPPHGKFKLNHPWKQYLKIGRLSRECASLIDSLNTYTISKSLTTATSSEFQTIIRQPCIEMSTESAKALVEIASAIKQMRPPESAETHVQKAKSAADQLKTTLQSYSMPPKPDLQEMVPLLVTASVLIDIISSVDEIVLSVCELSRKAGFKNPKSAGEQTPEQIFHRGIVSPVEDDGDHVGVDIQADSSTDSPEKKSATELSGGP
ncbi:hypothetical protein SASPL_136105 [Salvia splendens]|uniref:Aluminum-activated malate transporter n=1 Tax=Salvia splendens TaxID=180675 RepID=A0A8X8ZGB9_SALSN|nr:hypothetical protein SASPL_136105 [Salvia splendens]